MDLSLVDSSPLHAADPGAFQEAILTWYKLHGRQLPWRGTSNPYHVLVSEIMLQQTQVDRVIPKYHEFLGRFPFIHALAGSSTAEVLRTWQGLGYNRRAVNLKRAADVVLKEHGGEIPRTEIELVRLPGIGTYTSRAIACFAFGAQLAVVDTNVRRVLSGFVRRDLSLREAQELAVELLPAGRASDWNQALMDYGALVFKAKRRAPAQEREKFSSSNRFWRGRIVDALRGCERLTVPGMLAALPYARPDEQRIRDLVKVLHEEGMIQYDPGGDEAQLSL